MNSAKEHQIQVTVYDKGIEAEKVNQRYTMVVETKYGTQIVSLDEDGSAACKGWTVGPHLGTRMRAWFWPDKLTPTILKFIREVINP